MLIQLQWKTKVSNLYSNYGKTKNAYRLFPISHLIYILTYTEVIPKAISFSCV